MLIIQRPDVEASARPKATASGSPSARSSPASATRSATPCAARCCRRSPARRSRRCASTTRSTSSTPSPGVKEDVTDIILNLKDLVLHVRRPTSRSPLRLDVRGPADVTAGDIQTTADVEILNPDLHIATLNAKGRLAIDLTVEQGRGYLSAERNKTHDRRSASSRSTRSSRRCAGWRSTVEPTRVEQATNYDRLVLDIETDGSISPREALASAGDTLRSLVEPRRRHERRARRASSSARSPAPTPARPTSTSRSRSSTCPSVRATASSGPRSTRSASSCRRPRTTCSPSPTSARSRSTRSSQKLDERGLSLRDEGVSADAGHPEEGHAASAATPPTSG